MHCRRTVHRTRRLVRARQSVKTISSVHRAVESAVQIFVIQSRVCRGRITRNLELVAVTSVSIEVEGILGLKEVIFGNA